MAKGRKLTTSRSELFLGSLGYGRGQQTMTGASELGEDEIWSMVDTAVNGDDHLRSGEWSSHASPESNVSMNSYRSQSCLPAPLADHPRHQAGGLSLAFDDSPNMSSSPRIVHQFRGQDRVAESPRGRHVASSAPVNVPDWSKIYRVNSVESMHGSDDGFNDPNSELIPPHEYLAREYARTRTIAANSVFEGVGRTLKGRDMSRVRDAVWSQTGFDG